MMDPTLFDDYLVISETSCYIIDNAFYKFTDYNSVIFFNESVNLKPIPLIEFPRESVTSIISIDSINDSESIYNSSIFLVIKDDELADNVLEILKCREENRG